MTNESRRAHPLRTNWRQPVLTLVSMSVAVGLVAIVDPQPGALVLAAVLAMTVSRNKLVLTWRGRIEALILLPAVGLATAGVGYLLVTVPIVGASAYVVAMFLSIFLRRFGPLWTRVGTLIALPFITLLIAPGGGVGTTPLGVALLSVVVLVIVVALRVLAEITRFLPKPSAPPVALDASTRPDAQPQPDTLTQPLPPTEPAARPAPGQGLRPIASTRMAIQMAVALAAAFTLGALLFPQHVTWVVLTAFIVCSGNRGRADVLYKSGLRILGAAIGTVVASVGLIWLTPAHPLLQGPLLVIVLLAILGIGLWLREWTYAAWAVVMTLVITLLQGAAIHAPVAGASVPEGQQLWIRILAIIVGAACGLTASWFLLPVRSEGVVRKRVADGLRAISDYAADQNPRTEHELGAALDKLDEVAAPWRALERVTGWRKTARKPGQWMQLIHECAALVRANPVLGGPARRALGEARRSMRDPVAIGPSLLALRDELQVDG
ncbi:MAG TPA: FUSC family protein [Galbitalea sp.]